MGFDTKSRSAYTSRTTREAFKESVEISSRSRGEGSATKEAEREYQATGVLNSLVDPSIGITGCIRQAGAPFMDTSKEGVFELVSGYCPSIEVSLDSTGSMKNVIDSAIKLLPYIACSSFSAIQGHGDSILKEGTVYPQASIGLFNDRLDPVVLCRPNFEYFTNPDRLVKQLELQVPIGKGGDNPEDPHYSLFAGAYLTNSWYNKLGGKGYHFIVTDDQAREYLEVNLLIKIFGKDVFDRLSENGFSNITSKNIPSTREVFESLLKRAHAFVILVGNYNKPEVINFWNSICGKDRVIALQEIDLLPHAISSIIALTEGRWGYFVNDFLNSEFSQSLGGKISTITRKLERILERVPRGHVPVSIPKPGTLFSSKFDPFAMVDIKRRKKSVRDDVD